MPRYWPLLQSPSPRAPGRGGALGRAVPSSTLQKQSAFGYVGRRCRRFGGEGRAVGNRGRSTPPQDGGSRGAPIFRVPWSETPGVRTSVRDPRDSTGKLTARHSAPPKRPKEGHSRLRRSRLEVDGGLAWTGSRASTR